MSVTLHTTRGPLKVELECFAAPYACFNFLALCASGAYVGTSFHRLVPGFILQGGSTTPEGGVSIWGKPFPDEISYNLTFDKRGVVALATAGPNMGGSQFFITLGPLKQLNGSCTIFGHIIDGFSILEQIETTGSDADENPLIPVIIQSVEIHANPFADADNVLELP